MKNFLAIFKCAENSEAHLAWIKLGPQKQQELADQGSLALEKWTAKYKDRIVWDGGPLDEKTKFVDKKGVHDIPSQVGSFIVVKAMSHQEAAEIFLNHPHFAFFPGDGVEVVECRNRHDRD